MLGEERAVLDQQPLPQGPFGLAHGTAEVVVELDGDVGDALLGQVLGDVDLAVVFTPPTGQKLDDRFGPASHLVVSSSPPELLITGSGEGTELRRLLELADPTLTGVTEGVLHVSVRAASCDNPDGPGAAQFPACHIHQQDWGVPVRINGDGQSRLVLLLAGLAD